MHLIKGMRLIEIKGVGIEGGTIYRVWYPTTGGANIAKITMEECPILPAIALSCLLQC